MSRKVSCTVTVGQTSERHNHDLDYRETLEHVHGSKEAVVELIPYRDYREQINGMVRPYIEAYNQYQQERYEAAWERYNSGQIKTKPRKRDYQPMSFDYCGEHENDLFYNRAKKQNETIKLWRGLIFGLGDQKDRQENIITQEEAVAVMRVLVERWPELFPDFKLLGATIHLDEKGFYHCHIDYFPFFEKPKAKKQQQGLQVSHSQEGALEHMGFEPEQSIINGSDKVPIPFNAFRNRVYRVAEIGLNARGIRLEYGVSQRKEPNKDSSKNQALKNWQDIQDNAIELQKFKNHLTDIVEDEITPEHIEDAVRTANGLESLLQEVSAGKRSRMNKNNVVVEFGLFDQIKSYVREALATIARLFKRIDELTGELFKAESKIWELEEEVAKKDATIQRYKEANHKLQYKINDYCMSATENRKRQQFMEQNKVNGRSLEEWFQKNKREKTKE